MSVSQNPMDLLRARIAELEQRLEVAENELDSYQEWDSSCDCEGAFVGDVRRYRKFKAQEERIAELERRRDGLIADLQAAGQNAQELAKHVARLEREIERDTDFEVAKARALERKRYRPLIEVATRCHENLGFLAMHLAGRMGEGALQQIAELADETREAIRALGDE